MKKCLIFILSCLISINLLADNQKKTCPKMKTADSSKYNPVEEIMENISAMVSSIMNSISNKKKEPKKIKKPQIVWTADDFKIDSINYRDDRYSSAMINGEIFLKGESVAKGAKLINIYNNSVEILLNDGKVLVVKD